MKNAICVLVICSVFSSAALAAEQPDHFRELIEVDAKIGIHFSRDSGLISVTVFDPAVFDVVKDSRQLDQEQLDRKYPDLAFRREMQLKEFKASQETSFEQSDVNWKVESKIAVYASMRFCAVKFVGQDYIVVSDLQSDGKRTAYPLHRVSSIRWQNEVPLTVSRRRLPRK